MQLGLQFIRYYTKLFFGIIYSIAAEKRKVNVAWYLQLGFPYFLWPSGRENTNSAKV